MCKHVRRRARAARGGADAHAACARHLRLPLLRPLPRSYGTHVLLECARLYGQVQRFINVSTDEVYGETSLGKTEGLKEHSAMEPTNPYSAAKAGAEMMARAYHTSYKLPVIITRGNNVYGPHQFPEKMMWVQGEGGLGGGCRRHAAARVSGCV